MNKTKVGQLRQWNDHHSYAFVILSIDSNRTVMFRKIDDDAIFRSSKKDIEMNSHELSPVIKEFFEINIDD